MYVMNQKEIEATLKVMGIERRCRNEADEKLFWSLSDKCKYYGGKLKEQECTHHFVKELGRQSKVLLYCHFTHCPFKNGEA